jgi:hypothetical protein
MVDASEIRARIDYYRINGISTDSRLIERAIAVDKINKSTTPRENLQRLIESSEDIDRIRRGAKLHVPSDYIATIFTEKEGVCRVHGIYEYSEPEAPHKIESLPEVELKGIIRKTFAVNIIYIKIRRDDFDIELPNKVYSTKEFLEIPILTTDLMPVYYKLFKLEAQIIDVNMFLNRLASKRIDFSYKSVKDYLLNQLHWIINKELSQYDLLTAIKEKVGIQNNIEKDFRSLLKDIALELLGFVWDYDIDSHIRDRYFWLHVQNVPPKYVMRMETLYNMSLELSKSEALASASIPTFLGVPEEDEDEEASE